MVYAISVIVFPALAILMAINVLRIDKIVQKYDLDVFSPNKLSEQERKKVKKGLFYFVSAALAFVILIFVMASLKQ